LDLWIIDLHCPDAQQRPLIRDFIKLVDLTVGEQILDFSQLQSRPFCLFWPNILIYRFVPDLVDYRIIFAGTTTCKTYDKDLTGKLMTEMNFGPALKDLRKLNDQVMANKNRYYLSGIHDWEDKKYVKWWQIRMPLKRSGQVNEVLLCLDFENT